jgi:hypothetical protein
VVASEELRSKLTALREEKALAVMLDELGPVLTGRWLAQGQVPPGLAACVLQFWESDREPSSTLSEQAEESQLAAWTEAQLAEYAVAGPCFLATHLKFRPWLECAQMNGWTTLARAAIPEPQIFLSKDMKSVVAFLELEYCHAAFATTL